MHTKSKIASALVLASVAMGVALPAMAATTSMSSTDPMVVTAAQADAVPVGTLVPMIGTWDQADLAGLDDAKTVKVFDTRTLYKGADLTKIASADTSNSTDLLKLRTSIRGDSQLKSWFDSHDIDINRVIAIQDASGADGAAEVFLY